MSKIKVAILFGGRSTEHEISLLSAQNIVSQMNRDVYEPVLIAIDKSGQWYYQRGEMKVSGEKDPLKVALSDKRTKILFSQNCDDHYIVSAEAPCGEPISTIDVVWPVLHGTYGEDGAVQGLAKIANLPCVGPGILGSAMGMDKEVMKRLLRDGGIISAPWVTLRRGDQYRYSYSDIVAQLGAELFVKPVNLGSSVGISFVRSEVEFQPAIDKAFEYDNKVIIEQRVIGREIECAILGNTDPQASIPGEVIPKDGFYSFESKYVDETGAELVIPAQVNEEELERIQKLAIRTFVSLECVGMARVDMFLTPQGQLYINEINTLPGFTDVSMYPTLWRYSGIDNEALVARLIELAIEEHRQFCALKTEA